MAGEDGALPLAVAAPSGLAATGNGAGAERVSEIQRARILAAMVEACVEHGVANVTVAHVVARSGVSRRTFYEQFTDREDCFLATLDEAIACMARRVLAAYAAGGAWRERIRASLTALLQFLDEELSMGRLIVVETLGAGTGALERRQALTGYAVAAVESGGGEPSRGRSREEALMCEARGEVGGGGGLGRSKAGEEQPTLTGEGVVGGVLSVLHARLVTPDGDPLLELTSPLMSMIVLPYLGLAASRQELRRPAPRPSGKNHAPTPNPLRDLEMRLTYRTVCVLSSVANRPGSSNREIGLAAGVHDQGQISKLLTRLTKLGLIENIGAGQARGAPNEWTLTRKGIEVEQAVRSPVSA